MTTSPTPQLVLDQHGVLTRAQADALYGSPHVRSHLRRTLWQSPHRGVLVLHNGPLNHEQHMIAMLLACPPGSVLGGGSSLWWDGLARFVPERVQVVCPEGKRAPDIDGLEPHWSIWLDDRDVHPLRLPRRTRPARSLVDGASWARSPSFARTLILSGVQQRLTNTRNLRDALGRRGTCKHRRIIVESILDAAGGIQSLPERDFDQIRIGRGLPAPSRQVKRRRPDGKYYLDVAWEEHDAACEIHGIGHLDVPTWSGDTLRGNEIVLDGTRLLVFTSYAVRHERDLVGDQLVRLLTRR
ncbi:hypothetical protein [Mumia sp. DW29H23]|uniref:hypothetical protein n=1 Tax=Mumia sp. DW29H23 TaxID=3421241 RepID=UPI003D68E1E8